MGGEGGSLAISNGSIPVDKGLVKGLLACNGAVQSCEGQCLTPHPDVQVKPLSTQANVIPSITFKASFSNAYPKKTREASPSESPN